MRLSTLDFYKNEEVGKDRLGNPIYNLVKLDPGKGRLSNWTSEEIALDVREITRTHEKLITSTSLDICLEADVVELDSIKYEIKERTNLGRWRLLTVQAYRK